MASGAAAVIGSRKVGARTSSSRTPVAEEIVPNSGWTEDSVGHCLLVDLPGFKKEEVNLEFDDPTHIILRGERLITNEQRRVHFELIFPVPKDSDADKISGNFDSEILYVYVPKPSSSPQQDQNNMKSEIEEQASDGNEVESKEQHINSDNEIGRERVIKVQRMDENAKVEDLFSKVVVMSRSSGVEVLRRNKGIVVTAILAFSFGLYVSHKFQSLNVEP